MTTTPVDTAIDLSTQVAAEIRAWMGRRSISGARIARELGVSEMWVSTRLRGKQEIGLNDLQRIAGVLGVSYRVLLPANGTPGGEATMDRKSQPAERTAPRRPHDNRPPTAHLDHPSGVRRTARVPRTERP